MHSMAGAKYGSWFTVHYLQVYAKHFRSPYHMCNEGSSIPAKSFGSTNAEKTTVKGQEFQNGYFWHVSPAVPGSDATQEQHLNCWGWKHLAREGPFDGAKFVEQWQKRGSPLATPDLQALIDRFRNQECCGS
jgi:hypothetical protein